MNQNITKNRNFGKGVKIGLEKQVVHRILGLLRPNSPSVFVKLLAKICIN